jgi:hypothetical protein
MLRFAVAREKAEADLYIYTAIGLPVKVDLMVAMVVVVDI